MGSLLWLPSNIVWKPLELVYGKNLEKFVEVAEESLMGGSSENSEQQSAAKDADTEDPSIALEVSDGNEGSVRAWVGFIIDVTKYMSRAT